MKVLLAIDGSPASDAAVLEVARQSWPDGTEITIFTVVHAMVPLVPDPALVVAASYVQQIQDMRQRAPMLLRAATRQIRRTQPSARIRTRTVEGMPTEAILDEARAWDADLIVVGSHGYGAVRRLLLGSVARGVLANAPCSVLIAKAKRLDNVTQRRVTGRRRDAA
jgi:nucleotide-binding universal stress UspA family protein